MVRRLKLLGATACAIAACFGWWWLSRQRGAEEIALDRVGADTAVVGDRAATPVQPTESRRESDTAGDESGQSVDSASSGLLALEVKSEAGAPVPKALLVAFRGEEVLETRTTDSRGEASFAALQGRVELAVFAPGWAISRASIEAGIGRKTVTLPNGEQLAGWVRVDGGLPREAIELEFESKPPPGALASLPKSVRETLGPVVMQHGTQYAECDGQGAFSIRGLPRGSSGELSWNEGYWLESGGETAEVLSMPVAELRSDFEVRLITGNELKLRVVDEAGSAVPGANVRVELVGGGFRSISSQAGAADSEGRYRCSLGRSVPPQLEVRIARDEMPGESLHRLACPPGLRGTWDAGDLTFAPGRKLLVKVQDSSGAPIARPRAIPVSSASRTAVWGDGRGELELRLEREDERILVQALGYASEELDVPPGATHVVATLARTCLLAFTIAEPDGVDPMGLSVVVSGTPPIFVDDAPGAPPTLQTLDPRPRPKHPAEGTTSYRTLHREGRWTVSGLRAGVALKAVLQGGNGPPLAEQDLAPLSVGEHRDVELVLTRRPKSLRVQVVTPAGLPVPGAEVRMENAAGNGGRTDASGVFELRSIYADRFTLMVEANGHPVRLVRGVAVPPDEITVVLQESRDLEVALVERDGSPVTGAVEVRAGADAFTMQQGKSVAPGRWIVSGLPEGEVLVWAGNGGVPPVTRVHDTAVPSLRIEVGHPGAVRARISPPPPSGSPLAVALRDEAGVLVTRTPVDRPRDPPAVALLTGLALGTYVVQLETREAMAPCDWIPSGTRVTVVLDEASPSKTIELQP